MSKPKKMTKAERHAKILWRAQELYEDEGTLEIDDNAKVSEGDDNGAYVQAWVWVPFDGTVLCKGDGWVHDNCSEGCPVLDEMLDKAS